MVAELPKHTDEKRIAASFGCLRITRLSGPNRANNRRMEAPATHSRGKGKKKVVQRKKRNKKKRRESTVESKTLASDVSLFSFFKQQLDLTLGIKIGADLSKQQQKKKVTGEQNNSQ